MKLYNTLTKQKEEFLRKTEEFSMFFSPSDWYIVISNGELQHSFGR